MTRTNVLARASHWRCSSLGFCSAALSLVGSHSSSENRRVRHVTATAVPPGITASLLTRSLPLTKMRVALSFASSSFMIWVRAIPSSWSSTNANETTDQLWYFASANHPELVPMICILSTLNFALTFHIYVQYAKLSISQEIRRYPYRVCNYISHKTCLQEHSVCYMFSLKWLLTEYIAVLAAVVIVSFYMR